MAKNASYLLSVFIFSACLLSFLSRGHLPFICLLAWKVWQNVPKSFQKGIPIIPFWLNTHPQSNPLQWLHWVHSWLCVGLLCSLPGRPYFSEVFFLFLVKIILKMNQFRKTDVRRKFCIRDDQSNVCYHVHKYFIHKTLMENIHFIRIRCGRNHQS